MTNVRKPIADPARAGVIEYALVGMLIVVATISAYAHLGTRFEAHWLMTSHAIGAHLR